MPEEHECIQINRIDKIELALFGDEKLGEVGDHQMIKEIHALIVKGNAIRKFTVWFFGITMAFISAGILIWRFFKDYNK